MSSNLDRIATVDIALDSPISNDANFDNILIVGPVPNMMKDGVDVPMMGVYNSLAEITEMGFTATGAAADPIGVAARVAFSQSPRPKQVCIGIVPNDVASVFPDAEGENNDDAAPATVVDVMNYALEYGGWYCVCPVGLPKEKVKEIIQWTETQNKMCGYVEDDPDEPIVDAGLYLRSYPVYPKETEDQLPNDVPVENKYGMAVAMAAKAFHYHAGVASWALLPMAVVSPATLSSAFIKKLSEGNITYATNVASKNITMGGKTGGGEWIDVIHFRDWLQNDMQNRVVNLLVVNPKIPYTDAGIGLVENQMLASLKDGQGWGGIAPTEYDADGNPIPGYITSVPLAAELTAAQKASRVLENCRFSARIAGAIHLVEIKGRLTYENL